MRNINITPSKDILDNNLIITVYFLFQHDNALGLIQSPDPNNFGRNSNADGKLDTITYASAPKKSLHPGFII